MANLTWLHISDLHWRESEAYDANVVAQALLRDLANRHDIAPELTRIDFIFVTGDIAFAGRPEEYALARQFIDDLRSAAKVPKHRLFIVPGNHDIDRSAISNDAVRVVSALSNRQAINRLLGDEVDRAVTMQRFHRYQQFINSYFKSYLSFDSTRYFYVEERDLIDKRIAILGLNSAWASASDADRHNLFLGERQIRAALDQARRADIRIVLMHHPFNWLRDSDREDCMPLLMRGCDFVLHGHLHHTGVLSLRAPGSEAMIIGAGACYETREYPNAYNLVHLDFDSRKGVTYLRMYSDREGGFWTKDLLTYQDAPGEYLFDLPPYWKTAPSFQPESEGKTKNTVSIIEGSKAGLDRWWEERGYNRNPFEWSNAADVSEKSFLELFEVWYVDPQKAAHSQGLGSTPTLDGVMSPETSQPVLIYAPSGGGKTFYRRWAARLIEDHSISQYALEISNIVDGIPNPENMTARDLALCVFRYLCERFSVSKTPLPTESVERILERCEQVIRHLGSDSPVPKRVFVFVDDIYQLFDEHRSKGKKNALAIDAIVDFCRIAAQRGAGGQMALRMFIPAELENPIQKRLETLKMIHKHAISWSANHCQAIVERRLDSCWRGGPGTGTIHVSRLFSPDALDEFHRWLQQQTHISPRFIIDVLDRLCRYAYSRGVTIDLIGGTLWGEFIISSEPTVLRAPRVVYPLRQSWQMLLRRTRSSLT